MKVVIYGNTNHPRTGEPNNPYSWFVLTYRDGLRHNEIEPLLFDFKSHTLEAAYEWFVSNKPDVCFTHLTFHTNKHNPLKTMEMYRKVTKKVGTKFVHVVQDARTEDRYTGNISDTFLCAFAGTYPLVENGKRQWQIPVYYTPYSAMTYKKMSPVAEDLKFKEAVFTGGRNTHPDRKAFIDLLVKKGLPIRIFQTQSPEDLRHRTPELSVSVPCILGLCTGYDIGGYADVRWVQFGGCGAYLIMRKFKGFDSLLPEELYAPFDSYDETAADMVIDYYNRCLIEDTTKIRKKIFKFIQRNHSSKVRIKYILDIIRSLI